MSQGQLLQYIHFNRHHNTLLVQHNTKLIEDLRTENAHLIQENIRENDQISKLRTDVDNIILYQPGVVPMLVRKQCENPSDFFDKSFRDYQDGFAANGKLWKRKTKIKCSQVRLGSVWTSFTN